jgi:hypothetical protein
VRVLTTDCRPQRRVVRPTLCASILKPAADQHHAAAGEECLHCRRERYKRVEEHMINGSGQS